MSSNDLTDLEKVISGKMGLQHLEQLQEWKNDNDPRIQEKSRIKKDEIVSYGWKHAELASARYEIRKQDVIVTKNDITPLLRHAL